ncbi:MAG TPA: SOS response-associated peptidase, partial [Candidatus Angelobacter sp.]
TISARTINAVSETAAEKPAFREPMQRGRCLVPADGFYEWKKLNAKNKQPYNIGLADDSLFAFAGLWDRWRSPSGEKIESCTILTTDANSLLRDVHDRMPVMLRREDYDLWLDPGVTDPRRVQHLLRPFDARLMKMYPVSTLVNNANNDSPECIRPVEEKPAEPDAANLRLFEL